MSLRTPTVLTLGLSLAALLFTACKPAEADDEPEPPADPVEADDGARAIAEAVCASTFECECWAVEELGSEASCVDDLTAVIQARIDSYTGVGGSWDAQCAGDFLRAISRWQCLPSVAARDVYEFDPRACQVLRGANSENAECDYTGLIDECDSGLSCVSGQCYGITAYPIPMGEICDYGWEQLTCESGSYCEYDEVAGAQICKARPAVGDSCNPNQWNACGPGGGNLYCDASATCVTAPGVGEPCTDQNQCGAGTYCDGGEDFTCQPQAEIGEGCGANAVCPTDASCIGNICTQDPAYACNLFNWVAF